MAIATRAGAAGPRSGPVGGIVAAALDRGQAGGQTPTRAATAQPQPIVVNGAVDNAGGSAMSLWKASPPSWSATLT